MTDLIDPLVEKVARSWNRAYYPGVKQVETDLLTDREIRAAQAAILATGIEEAVEALKPFACFPIPLEEPDDDIAISHVPGFLVSGRLTYGNFRRAQALLTKLEQEGVG